MIIKNAYVVDPASGREGIFDIRIKKDKIEEVAAGIKQGKEKTMDAAGKVALPGLIDMHVHLREPGKEDMETVSSGTRAAITGGITGVCAMPNTHPPIDCPEEVEGLGKIIKNDALGNVYIAAAITIGRRGDELTDIPSLKRAGVMAISDDGNSVRDKDIMQKALKKAKECGMLVIAHCEDIELSANGVINEGFIATKLGLRGIPKASEYKAVERDIELAAKTGARIHIAHVSCKESVDIIRRAKKKKVRVTAETAPHYFSLTDGCCVTYDTRTKMNPPLRSNADVEAVIGGLRDGTIDVIASDHAPHGKHEKEVVFEDAAFGIIGLETSLTLSITNLVRPGIITLKRLVELMSLNPARVLGLKGKGTLDPGSDADITMIDPNREWLYKKERIASKSKNSPFIDWRLAGRVTDVILGGKTVLRDEELA